MKIMRVILFVVGISLILSLQSGCTKAKERTQEPAPIKPTPVSVKTTNTPPVDTTGEQIGKAPVLEVENPVFDFGTAGPNKKVKSEYKFKNTGDATLHINKVLAPCQCTTPELDKKDYDPGESGTLIVYYRSASYETNVQKHAHILSNAKNNPRFELTIKGRIEYKVAVTPKKINLFLNRENAGIAPITLKSKDGKPFSVRSLTSTQHAITADLDTTAEKTEFVIHPKVDREKLKKALSGKIDIRLSHPETNLVTLTYSSLPLYVFSPPRFVIQGVKPGVVVERQLWVKSNYQEKVEIESITSTKGYMEVVKRQQHGNSAKLTVRITPPPQEGKTRRYLSDAMKITMTDGESGTITMSGWYSLRRAN